jgi:hypothetical protein
MLTLHLPRKGMETFNEAIAFCNLIISYPQGDENFVISDRCNLIIYYPQANYLQQRFAIALKFLLANPQ